MNPVWIEVESVSLQVTPYVSSYWEDNLDSAPLPVVWDAFKACMGGSTFWPLNRPGKVSIAKHKNCRRQRGHTKQLMLMTTQMSHTLGGVSSVGVALHRVNTYFLDKEG